MKDFERLRESEIKLQYQLEESRSELQDQKRYVEQLRQELVAQRNLSMQQLHPPLLFTPYRMMTITTTNKRFSLSISQDHSLGLIFPSPVPILRPHTVILKIVPTLENVMKPNWLIYGHKFSN
jgi:hypothetical protein